MELGGIWSKAAQLIKERVGEQTFERWFSPLSANLYRNDSRIELAFPNKFFKDWVSEHYGELIKESVKNIAQGRTIEVVLSVNDGGTLSRDVSTESREDISPQATKPGAQNVAEARLALNPTYTFDGFVVGPSNSFAHAASLAVAESPAKAYNPLFIYGGVGLGKTHLMQAIGHQIVDRHTSVRLVYVSGEGFTNQLIDAIQHHTTPKFRERYRRVDILLIDDIQFIAGKEATQEEFFHTFNALYDAHKQIVISSDRPPKQIPNIEERLISRFEWGLMTDIQPPDMETRVAILRKKVQGTGTSVSEDVISFIADKIKSNIRELEGALIRVVAYAKFKGKPIVLDIVKDVLKDMLLEEEAKITLELIQDRVAKYFNIQPSNMKAKKRNRQIAYPRQIAMYIARELTDYSLFEIGEAFGGKDHTTVIYAQDKIRADIKKDVNKKGLVERLIKEIRYNNNIVSKT